MKKNLFRLSALILAVIMMFSLCSCSLSADDEEEEEIKYAQSIPETKQEIVERLNEAVASAKSDVPAVSYSLDQHAGGAECENEYIKSAFKTVAGYITKENFSAEAKYGESKKDVFPLMGSDNAAKLTVNDVRSAVIVDNKEDKTYTICIKINPESNPTQDSGVYGKIFTIKKDEEILKEFDSVSEFLTADSYTTEYGVGTITAVIDKETGHLNRLDLHRDVKVTTTVTGHGTLASVTPVELKFDYSSNAGYSVDWDNPETDAVEA